MIDKINRERHEHILTIEDPIEFLHPHKNCIVNQREISSDTHSFSDALRVALREDPDVVLIGEMRDLETVESALRIAETGHLTLATLHTNSAASTINRIVDIFLPINSPDPRAAKPGSGRNPLPSADPKGEWEWTLHGNGDTDSDIGNPKFDSRG